MNSKKKICVVVTARPSYSRIKTALTAINEHPNLELQLVVAASALLDRYGSVVDYIKKDGFNISSQVFMVLEGTTRTSMAKTTGIGISELASVFYNNKPDAVVTVADRYETMATAIAASYMNIPLIHIQGGEVTGNIDEKVRHAITKLADLHLVASNEARNRVIKLGEEPDSVINTGCPSIDLAEEVKQKPNIDYNLFDNYGGVGPQFDYLNEDYLVVMQHPVTSEVENAQKQIETTIKVIDELDMNVFWFWPNIDAGSDSTSKGLRIYRELNPNSKIHFFKNMEGRDFLKLLKNSKCLIGNSSVGIRECSYLSVPVVNIGSRQNKRERGDNVIDVNYSELEIKKAILTQIDSPVIKESYIYGDGQSGKRIAEVIYNWNPVSNKVITY